MKSRTLRGFTATFDEQLENFLLSHVLPTANKSLTLGKSLSALQELMCDTSLRDCAVQCVRNN